MTAFLIQRQILIGDMMIMNKNTEDVLFVFDQIKRTLKASRGPSASYHPKMSISIYVPNKDSISGISG